MHSLSQYDEQGRLTQVKGVVDEQFSHDIAGGLNNYQYVQNPVNWVDPLGLAGVKADCPPNGTGNASTHTDVEPDVVDVHDQHMLGANGTQTASKTLWKGKGKERIDVENPNPGQRSGQIHYQDNQNNKYLYDAKTDSFPGAPNSVNKMLGNRQFKLAIMKGLKQYLGEK